MYVSSCAANVALALENFENDGGLMCAYSQSKAISEVFCRKIHADVKIHSGMHLWAARPGYLVDTVCRGTDPLDPLEMFLVDVATCRSAPQMGRDLFIDLTPVQYAASAVISGCLHYPIDNGMGSSCPVVLSLHNPAFFTFDRLWLAMQALMPSLQRQFAVPQHGLKISLDARVRGVWSTDCSGATTTAAPSLWKGRACTMGKGACACI